MTESQSLQVLSRVVGEVVAAARARKESGKLPIETLPFVTRSVEYGSGGLTVHMTEIVKELPSPAAIQEVVSETRRHCEAELEVCATEIAAARDAGLGTARGDIEYFVSTIAGRALERDIDLEDEVRRFLMQAMGGEIAWRGMVMLGGLAVDEACEFAPGHALRPVQGFNFIEETHRHTPSLIELTRIPTVILEVTTTSVSRPAVGEAVNAMSLFRLGSVEVLLERWDSDSLLPGRSSECAPHRYLMSSSIVAPWSAEDARQFAELFRQIQGKLPLNPLGHHPEGGWRTALKYYFHALRTATDEEERLAQAVSALEAVLAQDREGEITRVLSQRTASLLRFVGLPEGKVLKNVKQAYGLRSTYAHGSRFKDGERRKVHELWHPILDYVRLCIVKASEFNVTDWRKVLKLLDEALLVPCAYSELEELVRGGLWQYAAETEHPPGAR